ncbi:coiled-coil domain-containing protein 136 isoform X2 [Ascaphus truei]|uniref:coiled-coil domain-containing protein 136 isoform X2 n=1 Tax=Ascaphus truei TaxID=8439 RepID=UPI003F596490
MGDVDGQSSGRAQQMTGSSPGTGSSGHWLSQPLNGMDPLYSRELLNDSEDEESPDLGSESGDRPCGSAGGRGSILLQSQDLRTQIIQLLTELEETRELALKHEDSFLEMQGILEEERLASAQQAEIFTKQIQRLQAQLHSVQEEVDSLEQEKECELVEVSQELHCAQEEILSLRHTAEEAASDRENDIASLQEELCRLRAELHQLQDTRQEYEMEITSLRAEISMKSGVSNAGQGPAVLQGELQFLRDQCQHLRMEHRILQGSNSQLKSHLLLLEEDCSGVDIDPGDGGDKAQGELGGEDLTDTPIPQHDPLTGGAEREEGAARGESDQPLKPPREDERQKLQSAEEKVQLAQSECAGLLCEMEELQQRHRVSQEEQDKLQEELRMCREEIHRLKESGSQAPYGSDPPVLSLHLIGLVIIVGMLWCWWAETS